MESANFSLPSSSLSLDLTCHSNPKVMLKVGNEDDVGPIEMQDLIFTNRGPTAGLIMVEWNVRADSPGSAALWGIYCAVSILLFLLG